MKILIVDDSRMAIKMLLKTLKEHTGEEDEVFTGKNGLEAVSLYKEQSPSLVFLDLTMPEMDGFTALKEIKKINKDARVVIVSADIQKGSMDKVRKEGAFDFVKKPITAEKMQDIFNKLQTS